MIGDCGLGLSGGLSQADGGKGAQPFRSAKAYCERWPHGPHEAAGGWRWTFHSPTGSGPEGSSPNEIGRVSVQPPTATTSALGRRALARGSDRPVGPMPAATARGRCHERRRRRPAQAARPRPTACWPANTGRRSFADLIGQERDGRTLSNAFDLDRIHQAYLLTGVRGVGKTTTARIMARALNYHRPRRRRRRPIDAPTIAHGRRSAPIARRSSSRATST